MAQDTELEAFRGLVDGYAETAEVGPVEVEESSRLRDWARGARRRGRAVVLVSPRLLRTDQPVQSWFAAHEVARLALKNPRRPGERMLVQGGILTAPWAAALLAIAATLQTSPAAGLVLAIASAIAVILFVASLWLARRLRSDQFQADVYAVIELDAPFSKAQLWGLLCSGEDRWLPAGARTGRTWTERFMMLFTRADTAAVIRSQT